MRKAIESWEKELLELKGLLYELGAEADSFRYNVISAEALSLAKCIIDAKSALLRGFEEKCETKIREF